MNLEESLHMHISAFVCIHRLLSSESFGPRSIDTALVYTGKHLQARFISADSARHRFGSIVYCMCKMDSLSSHLGI